MNLKDEILALRNRTQLLAENLHLVVSSLNDTLNLVEIMYPGPGPERAQNTMRPVPNAKVFANAEGDGLVPYKGLLSQLAETPTKEPLRVTTAEAAEQLGCSTRMIALHVDAKRLVQPKRGYITQESVQALLEAKAAKEKGQRPTSRPGSTLAEDQVPHADVMAQLGCNLKKIMNLKYTKQLTGGRSYVDKQSLEAYMVKKGLKAKAPAPENNKLAEASELTTASMEDLAKPLKKPRFQFDEPKPIVKDLPATTWEPPTSPSDKWEAMDKVAKELEVNLSWLQTVKRSGRIHGAPDWINRTQLDAYLKHPDFDEPLIDRAED